MCGQHSSGASELVAAVATLRAGRRGVGVFVLAELWRDAISRHQGYDMCANKSWARALKIWTTRERIKDENKKRKSTTAIPNPLTPSKIPRRAESVGRVMKDIGSSVALPPRGRSP
ncbi:hypothetical protein BJX64DRAFT_283605 [Aspergillus heterothallicus]